MYQELDFSKMVLTCPTLQQFRAANLFEFQASGQHIADPIVLNTVLATTMIDNLPYAVDVCGFTARVTKAPTDAAITLTFVLDGVDVTTLVPTIAATATEKVWRDDDADPNPLAAFEVPAGSRLGLYISQIGSTEPGENLSWTVTFRRK